MLQCVTTDLLFLEVGFTGGGERCAAEACALPLPKTRVSWTALQAYTSKRVYGINMHQTSPYPWVA